MLMNRRAAALLTASLLSIAGCAQTPDAAPPPAPIAAAPVAAAAASVLPTRPAGAAPLAASTLLTKIAIGSCSEETEAMGAFSAILKDAPQAFIYAGDNVYGDVRNNNAWLPELRQAYIDLAKNPDFLALNAQVPIWATWDDHDYGLNDAGGDFPFKGLAEAFFETFWGVSAEVAARPGIYDSAIYGPEGQRTQIIMLDTRFFRSPLKATDARNAPGRERYVPDADPAKTVLGEEQWAWLAQELAKPAELRLIVSSIQVISEAHGWEAWRMLSADHQRFYNLLRDSQANGVVLLSGDRHHAALFKKDGVGAYPLYEMTASSINRAFRTEVAEFDEGRQLSPGYAPRNYGLISIDWQGAKITLDIKDEQGAAQRSVTIPFAEINAG